MSAGLWELGEGAFFLPQPRGKASSNRQNCSLLRAALVTGRPPIRGVGAGQGGAGVGLTVPLPFLSLNLSPYSILSIFP